MVPNCDVSENCSDIKPPSFRISYFHIYRSPSKTNARLNFRCVCQNEIRIVVNTRLGLGPILIIGMTNKLLPVYQSYHILPENVPPANTSLLYLFVTNALIHDLTGNVFSSV